ncbi:Glutamate receptor-like 27, partial [Homarus americanus]
FHCVTCPPHLLQSAPPSCELLLLFIILLILRTMERRHTKVPTDLADRVTFVRLWVGGRSIREIAEQTNVSVTTVYRWIKRWQNQGNVNNIPRKEMMTPLLLLLTTIIFPTVAQIPRPSVDSETLSITGGAVKAVLSIKTQSRCSVVFLTDGTTSPATVLKNIRQLVAPWSVALFEVAVDGQDANVTQAQLSRVVAEARRLRQVSWCVTVVVVSDDPAFLAAFAEWSLKGRLLVWSTRLLVVTRRPLPELHHLHKLLSMTNSILLVVDKILQPLRCGLFLKIPFTDADSQALRVASWSAKEDLVYSSQTPLFPDKFSKLANRPTLIVPMIETLLVKAVWEESESQPGGKRLTFPGFIQDIMEYLSQGFNFSFVIPADGSSGSKQADGSWSGMVGMVMREVEETRDGPVGLPSTVHPDGLGSHFDIATGITGNYFFLSSYLSSVNARRSNEMDKLGLIRLLLSQNFSMVSMASEWWWELLFMAVWMLMTLVLRQSYNGNLISHLAVRYIPEPYQTLQEVVDDSSAKVIWMQDSSLEQSIRVTNSGTIREVADLEIKGRVKRKKPNEFFSSADTLVAAATTS